MRDGSRRLSIARAVYDIIKDKADEEISFDELKRFLGIEAPVQICICNDTRGITDARIAAASRKSCYAATQNLILAAPALELGACWQGDPLLARDEVRKLYHIPEGVEPVSSITLGYPMKNPEPPLRKHSLDEILFYENM